MFKLDSDEKVVLELRKHWFVIFVQGFILSIIALLPGILAFVVLKFFPTIKQIDFGGSLVYLFSFGYFIWLLILWLIFFLEWTDYYLDVWYVTPTRIIAIEQKGLFRRETINLRFEKVQDATVEISGIIPTFLGFGEIHVQTAGAGREIILKDAKNPHEAKKIILDLHSKILEKESGHDHLARHE